LKVGYLDAKKRKSEYGTPQGSILSPLLANVVLHELDKYICNEIKQEYTLGKERKMNPVYTKLANKRKYLKKYPDKSETRRELLLELRKTPNRLREDPNFKRMLFIRYADDFVVLLAGTRKDALDIKEKISTFLLTNCGLILNQEKTTIVPLKQGFQFLGAFCKKRKNISIHNSFINQKRITRRSTLRLGVDAPILFLINKLIKNGFARRNHENVIFAKGITSLIHLDHTSIIQFFNGKIRGLLSYYSFAGNYSSLNKICWIFRQSCALTLARKFKLKTMRKTFKKFGFDLKDIGTDIKLEIPTSFTRKSKPI